MRIFAVHISDDSPVEVANRLRVRYPAPQHYELSGRFFLVSDETISEFIAENIGIKGDNRTDNGRGAVFGLNGEYSGFDNRAIWEWLELWKHRKAHRTTTR